MMPSHPTSKRRADLKTYFPLDIGQAEEPALQKNYSQLLFHPITQISMHLGLYRNHKSFNNQCSIFFCSSHLSH